MTSLERAFRLSCLGWLLLTGWLTLTPIGIATAQTAGLASSDTNADEPIVVKIRARQFDPDSVRLHAGRSTILVLRNEDAELHAFVPGNLFAGVSLNISGNGAPEFTDQGFKRVIIPSEGRAEIRFVPDRVGVFPFICDMPGHEMRATIIVE